MKIKRKYLTKSLILHIVSTFLLSKFCNLVILDFQYLSIEAAIIPSNNIQTTKLPQLDLRENDEQENQPSPIVERIEIRLIDNKENGSNEKQLMIVDVVKKQGLVAATIQQNEFMDKQNTKPWFLVRIRQPYYHSKISEPVDQKNETSENEINNNLISKGEENNETVEIEEEILNNNLFKNDSREEDKDYLEDERNRTMVFDDREECLLNKANLEGKVIQRLVNERRRIVRTIKKINRNQSQLCRMDRRRNQEKVLYRNKRVDVVKKQGLVAATIQQQNEFMDKQNTKPWFLVRIRQPYYHSKIFEPFDQKNETSEKEINNNLINKVENETVEIENELMLNDNLLKNDSREEDKDYLEDERNRTMVFDDREECLLNKANLEKKIIQRLVNERRRIVRTIKKINRNQSQLCRMDRRRDQGKVLYRKCPMWRREKFFLYYALMRITYCGNHARWPGGIYYNEY
uniref:Uncharacterized protein n=1 Tax=Meloidogyne incognita TaxID=6306 RepID=A0A914LAI3_MELIC